MTTTTKPNRKTLDKIVEMYTALEKADKAFGRLTEVQERDLKFTKDLVAVWPLILGGLEPGWNIGERYDVRVMVMQGLFAFGTPTACVNIQIFDKQEEAPFDKREQIDVLRISYKYPNLRALDKEDVTGVATVSFRGEQMPVEKLLRIRK